MHVCMYPCRAVITNMNVDNRYNLSGYQGGSSKDSSYNHDSQNIKETSSDSLENRPLFSKFLTNIN
jgi:hypothetical protein